MFEEDPLCPECGYELTGIKIFKDDVTAEITIEFFCDQAGEDMFTFQILTGLTDYDIAKLTEIGKKIPRKMALRLVKRKSEEEAIQEYDANRTSNL